MTLLNQTVEYACRLMAHLSTLEEGQLAVSKDLSKKTGVPGAYVSKVMRRLVVAGLVDSQRGRGGGFSLARPAEEICFMDILRALDYDAQDRACAFGFTRCNPAMPCPLHPAWSDLTDCFEGWALRTTLASVDPAGVLPPALFGR